MPTPSETMTTAASPGIRPIIRHACRTSPVIAIFAPWPGDGSTRRAPCRLGSAGEFARLGVDLDLLALFDEQRDADLHAGLERRHLRDAAACGIAARAGLGRLDGDLDVRWKHDPERLVVVGVDLDQQVV